MYGGGFSTVPAYLRDMFGTRYVGAIHGLLLTAWSAAGIFGPVLVNYIREYNVTHGVPKAQAYNTTMYIMAGLLVIGFICNFFVKAVARALPHEGNDDRGVERRSPAPRRPAPGHKGETNMANANQEGTTTLQLVLAWGFVGIPLTLGRAANAGQRDEAVPVATKQRPPAERPAALLCLHSMTHRLEYGIVRESPRRVIHVVRVRGAMLDVSEIGNIAERMRNARVPRRGGGRGRDGAGSGKETLRLTGDPDSVSRVRAAMFNAALQLVADRARLTRLPLPPHRGWRTIRPSPRAIHVHRRHQAPDP